MNYIHSAIALPVITTWLPVCKTNCCVVRGVRGSLESRPKITHKSCSRGCTGVCNIAVDLSCYQNLERHKMRSDMCRPGNSGRSTCHAYIRKQVKPLPMVSAWSPVIRAYRHIPPHYKPILQGRSTESESEFPKRAGLLDWLATHHPCLMEDRPSNSFK